MIASRQPTVRVRLAGAPAGAAHGEAALFESSESEIGTGVVDAQALAGGAVLERGWLALRRAARTTSASGGGGGQHCRRPCPRPPSES